jgi:shikimate dehydrogenase
VRPRLNSKRLVPVSSQLQQICACLGQPVAGNPTQYMMERAFAHHHLDWRYLTLEVPPEQLGDAIRGLRALGFRGGNITKPHKCKVIQHLDATSEAAALMGAVNCINRDGERLIGENTDGKGFVQSLRTVADPAGKRVAILGAGGAARAIAVELALSGVGEVTIVNRTRERGQELVDLLAGKLKLPATLAAWEDDYSVPEGIDVLINATSVGLFEPEARVNVDVESLQAPLVVADVVFNPPETRLLRDARQRGCTVLDGLGMLVNQAVIGFEIWTGIAPDAAVMREALEEFLEI